MSAGADTASPYCGAPPDPATLWSRWNLDPWLIAALLAVAGLYAFGRMAEGRAGEGRESAWFYGGWALTALALVSPLCALSVSLFSARVVQHMVIALAAAPMMAVGRPGQAMMAALGRPGRLRDRPFLAAGAFAGALWLWHVPGPYDLTFRSDALYWLMHASIVASAVWLWGALLDRRAPQVLVGALLSLVSTVQMGLLGALITFAPRPLFAPHLDTAAAWGFTALQDQQLGGVLMWVPGCLVFLGVTLGVLHGLLAEVPARGAPQ